MKAVALTQSGQRAEAQKLLEPHIRKNPHDVKAWLCETETWSSQRSKIRVLEMCLEFNPGNQKVMDVLDLLRKSQAKTYLILLSGFSALLIFLLGLWLIAVLPFPEPPKHMIYDTTFEDKSDFIKFASIVIIQWALVIPMTLITFLAYRSLLHTEIKQALNVQQQIGLPLFINFLAANIFLPIPIWISFSIKLGSIGPL